MRTCRAVFAIRDETFALCERGHVEKFRLKFQVSKSTKSKVESKLQSKILLRGNWSMTHMEKWAGGGGL